MLPRWGLIVNELVSNALEHGFDDRQGGNIWLKLQCIESEKVLLTIEDNSVGFKEGLDLHNNRVKNKALCSSNSVAQNTFKLLTMCVPTQSDV